MDVEKRLAIIQREIADEGYELGLLVLLVAQIGIGGGIKIANDRAAQSADAGDISCHQIVFFGKSQQSFHYLLPSMEYQEVVVASPELRSVAAGRSGLSEEVFVLAAAADIP